MTTAIHFRTSPAPALDRDRKRLLRDIALGHLLATSIAALTLAAGPVWAQSPQPSQAPQAQQAPQSPQVTPAPQPPELTGAAWVAADRAYAAQREKRYADAVTYAREALKLRPDVARLWLLLMDALDAQGKTAEAVVAGNAAIAAGITDQALTARVRSQSRVLAQEPSVAANKALEASNPKAAIEQARKAVALVPDDLSYRVLLVYTLLADGQLEAADKAASEAIQVDPQSFLPRTLRGYVRMRLGKVAEAEQDFDTALKDEVLSGPTAHDARLVMADAAIAAGHPQRAIKLLEPVEPDAAVQARLRVARAQERNPKVVPANAAQTLPVPFQKCIDTPYGPSCSLIPATTPPGGGVSDTPGYDAALEAFGAYREGNDNLSEARIREALKENPGNAQWRRLLIDSLDRSKKYKELDVAIRDAISQGDNDPSLIALRAANDKRLAEPMAVQAIKDIGRGKATNAVTSARQAVERAPDALIFRIVLIDALMAAGQFKDAETAASGAVADNPNEPLPHILRAWLLQKTGQRAEAVQEFDTVLNSNLLTDLEELNYRLIAANAAMAAGQPEQALKALEPLDADKNKEVGVLRKQAETQVKAPNAAKPSLQQPAVLCQPTSYGVICSVFANPQMQAPGVTGLNPGSPGYAAASAAYAAFGRKDYATAIAEARRAVDAEPGNRNYQTLLLNALSSAGRYSEAEAVANRLLAASPRDATLLVQRANLRMQAKDFSGAVADYKAALGSPNLPPAQVRIVRLGLADAALSAKQPEVAIWALQPYANEDSYEVQARLGFASLALDDKEGALAAFTRAAARARTSQERMAMLSARIGVLSQLGRKDEARALFQNAYNSGALRGMKAVDLAVLASQAGDDELAYEYFSEANSRWRLRGTNLINAAYNARRTYHNAEAVDYFKSAIDEAREGKLQLDPQYLFGLRREVAELTRTWGAYASVSYGPVGVAPGSYLVPQTSNGANHTVGTGGEIYWRPPGIGYRDGSIFELFVRGFGTVYADNGGATGFDTIQGSVGARWKPFSTENLVFEISYLFPVGQFSRNDLMLRAAYSKAEGTDLRVDVDNWRAWQIYADYNYFVSQPQTVATFEGRYGQAFRMDAISDHLVLWPYIAIGGGYDTAYATPFAMGIGPGITARYWFNEDEYTAPRSYLDFTLQYRWKLAGDDRAQGIFAGAFLSY